jgi:phosphoribosylanthranilate isomerase
MLELPVFLAGGLNPANAAEAVSEVGPFGLDVCSGLRVDGKLDPQLLFAFFRATGLSSVGNDE